MLFTDVKINLATSFYITILDCHLITIKKKGLKNLDKKVIDLSAVMQRSALKLI